MAVFLFCVCVQVDFERLVAQTEAVRRQSTARDARRDALAQQRLSEVHAEIAGKQSQFLTLLTQTLLSIQIRNMTLRVF